MSPADGLTPVVPDDAPELKPTVTGGKKAWNSSLPIPDYFYDIGFNLAPIASLRLVRFFSFCLYLVTAGVFVGTQVYYAMPAQLLSADIKVSSEWQQDGYTCRPLQDANLHGLSTAWTFDECVAKVQPPTDANIVEVEKADGSTHFDYQFATEAVYSAYDNWRGTSVLQASGGDDDWKRDGGYSCWPESPADKPFNVSYNYTECLDAVLPPSAETVAPDVPLHGGIYFTYYPFGTERPCYPKTWADYQDRKDTFTRMKVSYPSLGYFDQTFEVPGITGYFAFTEFPRDAECFRITSGFRQYDSDHSSWGGNNPANVTEAVLAWTTVTNTPAPDKFGGYGTEFICSEFKRNTNGFRCFNAPTPPTSRDEAVKQYTAETTPDSLCAPLKQNSPFQCTRQLEVPLVTRLNLSLAASQALFGMFGLLSVYLLRRVQSWQNTSNHPSAKPPMQDGSRIKKVYSFVYDMLPIPDYYYDVKTPVPIIGNSIFRIYCMVSLQYVLQFVVFIAAFMFYSMPAQLLSTESKVTPEWQQDGYTCRPLRDANLHGLSTAWTFDECVAKVQPPTDANIVEVEKADGFTHFDYRFATEADSSGVLSAYDTWRDTAVLQASGGDDDWKRDGGYSCWPVFPYLNTFNVRYNYTECLGAVMPPKDASLVKLSHPSRLRPPGWQGSGVYDDKEFSPSAELLTLYAYHPFGASHGCYPDFWPSFTTDNNTFTRLQAASPPSLNGDASQGQRQYLTNANYAYGAVGHRFGVSGGSSDGCFSVLGKTGSMASVTFGVFPWSTVTLSNDAMLYECYVKHDTADITTYINNYYCNIDITAGETKGVDFTTANITLEDAIAAWNEILSTSPDKYGGFGNELICSEMKRNTNGFQCFDDSKSPPTTRDEAVKHYAAAENTPESLCAPLKQNSPFECSRVLETTLVIRLSLSFAASQAIFDLFGLFLVFILRRVPSWQRPNDGLDTEPTVASPVRRLFSFVYDLMPIPDYYYDVKATVPLIVPSRSKITRFSYALYLVGGLTFAAAVAYYSTPAQLLSDESMVTTEWQQDGYTCRPLQAANLHGLSTAWTFDECVAKVQPPTDANIVEVEKADGSTHFDYRFATEADSSGVLSAYDTWRDTAVLQASGGDDDWKRDGGYSCWPVFPYQNTFNVRYNYTECLGAVLPATLTGGVRKLTCDWNSCCAGAGGCMIFYVYYPFGPEEKCYMNAGWPSLRDITMQERLLAHYGDNNRFGAGLVMTQYNNEQTTIDVTGQAPNQPWQAQDGCLGFQDYQNHAPGDVTVVNDWWTKAVSMPPDTYGGFDKEFICSEMKRNTNGFQCFDDSKSPPTTRDEAVKHYAAAENTPESLCAPLKQNSPFECTTPVEVALVTRINLALSAAQAIFAACGMMFVYLLRRLSSGGD